MLTRFQLINAFKVFAIFHFHISFLTDVLTSTPGALLTNDVAHSSQPEEILLQKLKPHFENAFGVTVNSIKSQLLIKSATPQSKPVQLSKSNTIFH